MLRSSKHDRVGSPVRPDRRLLSTISKLPPQKLVPLYLPVQTLVPTLILIRTGYSSKFETLLRNYHKRNGKCLAATTGDPTCTSNPARTIDLSMCLPASCRNQKACLGTHHLIIGKVLLVKPRLYGQTPIPRLVGSGAHTMFDYVT
jgi:hypothetical protein